MSASATLAGLTLGIGLMILGLQLVSDNWQQEMNDRKIRETAMLENMLLIWVPYITKNMFFWGWILFWTGVLVIQKFKYVTMLALPIVLTYGLVFFNPILYQSQRLGGEYVVNGFLFYLCFTGAIMRISLI